MVELAPMMASVRERVRLFYAVVATSPLLLGRDRAQHLENVELLAKAIAARRNRPVDPHTLLVAEVATTVLDRAHARWLTDPDDQELADVIVAYFETTRAAFAEAHRLGRRRSRRSSSTSSA
jgi:hypothetical protein